MQNRTACLLVGSMLMITSSVFGLNEGQSNLIGQFPDLNNTNIKINSHAGGSVLTSLVANLTLGLLYLVAFFLCCRQLPLFNPKKKRRLFEEYLRDLEEEKDTQSSRDEVTLSTNTIEGDAIFYQNEHHQSIQEPKAETVTSIISEEIENIGNHYPFNKMTSIPKEPTQIKRLFLSTAKEVIVDAFESTILFFPTLLRHFWDGVTAFFIPSRGELDSKRMCKKYGRDITVYFYFQQVIIWVLLVSTILACAVLLPIHLTGSLPVYEYNLTYSTSAQQGMQFYQLHQNGVKQVKNLTQEDSALLRTTVEMVISSPIKMYAHVVISIICFSVCLFVLYRFNSSSMIVHNSFLDDLDKSIERTEEHPLGVFSQTDHTTTSVTIHTDKYKLIDPKEIISPFVVKITGLPKDMTSVKEFQSFVETYFNDGLSINDERGKIARSILIFDFLNRMSLDKVLSTIEEDLDHFIHLKLERGAREYIELKEHIVVDEGVVDSKSFLLQCFGMHTQGQKVLFLTTEEAIKHLKKRKRVIRNEIKKWDDSYNKLIHESVKKTPSVESLEDFSEVVELEDVEINNENNNDDTLPKSVSDDPVSSLFVEKSSILSSGVAFIIFNTYEDAQEALHRYEKNEIRLQNNLVTIHPLEHEPLDTNWYNICQSGLTGLRHEGAFTNIMHHLFLIAFFIIASSPVAILSSLQSIFNVGVVKMELASIEAATGIIGNLVFQFIPSLLLYWISRSIGIVIHKVTMLGRYDSKQEYGRIYILRKYVYVVLTILVLPSLWLSSVDGIVNYIKTQEDFQRMLSLMFLPSSGALMLSTVMQFALISNMDDLLRLEDACFYIWKTKLSFYRKAKSPLEKLKATCNQSSFSVDTNYAKMLAVFTLVMTYAVFIPLILPCGLFYMMMKHMIDRYLVHEIYDDTLFHDHAGIIDNKPKPIDYLALQKKVALIGKITIMALIIPCGFLMIFFGLRIFTGPSFLPHFIFVASVAGGLVALLIHLQYNQEKFIQRRVMREVTNQDRSNWSHFVNHVAFVTPFDSDLGNKHE